MPPIKGPASAVPPEQWGARIRYDGWTDRFTPDDGIAIHYGGGANIAGDASRAATRGFDFPSLAAERSVLRTYERYHLNKGWRGLAYGWAVGQSGLIYRIRGWNRYGAHLGDVDGDGIANNDEVIPVLFILGKGQRYTAEAQAAFESLREWMQQQSGRGLALYGHQEVQRQGTSCPGRFLMDYVREHRSWIPDLPTEPHPPEEADMYEDYPVLEQTYPGLIHGEGSELRFFTRTLQGQLAIHGEIASNTFDEDHTADGIFGPGSKAAVVRFQNSRAMISDGVVGAHTWEALYTHH